MIHAAARKSIREDAVTHAAIHAAIHADMVADMVELHLEEVAVDLETEDSAVSGGSGYSYYCSAVSDSTTTAIATEETAADVAIMTNNL